MLQIFQKKMYGDRNLKKIRMFKKTLTSINIFTKLQLSQHCGRSKTNLLNNGYIKADSCQTVLKGFYVTASQRSTKRLDHKENFDVPWYIPTFVLNK